MSSRKSKQKSDIRDFFQNSAKKLRIETQHLNDDIPGPSSSITSTENKRNKNNEAVDSSLPSTSLSQHTYDIGSYVYTRPNAEIIDDVKKESVFRNTWVPPLTYIFPVQQSQSFTRHFQHKWLNDYPWLAYSDIHKGLFCKTCVLFLTNLETGKGSHQQVNQFVRSPFTNWKKATESFANHAKLNYHKDACTSAENFLSVFDSKTLDVCLQINTKAKKEADENRKKLRTIIQTLKFCGRQELALRGHIDSGRLTLEEPIHNDGNFRALLRFRVQSGDEVLKEHLLNSAHNAMYTSPDIQNEFIQLIGAEIISQIVKRAIKSRFFTVLADETTDISRIEQFSLCIRYIDLELYVVREDFLSFVPVHDVTGVGLARTIKDQLQNLGLDLQNLRGQGYDGAAAMRGAFNGVQAIIQNEFPKAIYTHCISHCLNLCLNDACKIDSVRNAFGVISEVCTFFRTSARRTAILSRKLESSDSASINLKKYCETRWVERHDAISLFCESITETIQALEDLIESKGADSGKAQQLHYSLCNFSFLIALFVTQRMLSLTHALSKNLQSVNIDLCSALASLEITTMAIFKIREHAEDEFSIIYSKVCTTAALFGIEPSTPRLAGTQRHRRNVSADSIEEHYRRATFIPFVEYLLQSLNDRFVTHRDHIIGLQKLIPSILVKEKKMVFVDLKPVLEFYRQDLLNNDAIIQGEWELWQTKWRKSQEEKKIVPSTAIEALRHCDVNFFPNLHTLLQILATLAISTATVERSFSTLKRLKIYLRNSTGQTRLTGLALMSIHRELHVDDDILLNKFLTKKNRRIQL